MIFFLNLLSVVLSLGKGMANIACCPNSVCHLFVFLSFIGHSHTHLFIYYIFHATFPGAQTVNNLPAM